MNELKSTYNSFNSTLQTHNSKLNRASGCHYPIEDLETTLQEKFDTYTGACFNRVIETLM